jgi:ankyrin repeat protein
MTGSSLRNALAVYFFISTGSILSVHAAAAPCPQVAELKPSDATAPPLHTAVWNRQFKQAQVLLKKGAAVDQRAADGSTALITLLIPYISEPMPQARRAALAQAKRDVTDIPKFMALLLSAKADPNAADRLGMTPLLTAVRHGARPDVIRQLLAGGAQVNKANAYGVTPLMMAADSGTSAAIPLLTAAGADTTLKDCRGQQAADFAIAKGDKAMAKSLTPTFK